MVIIHVFPDSSQLLLLHSLAQAHSFISPGSGEPMFLYGHSTTFFAVDNIYAHHTLVSYKQNFCSGSFIGSKIVITAASCFQAEQPPYDIYVKYGFRNFLDEGQIVAVIEKKEHEYFQYESKLDNDIALLVLEKHVPFDYRVRKVVLSRAEFVLPTFSRIMVTGWRKDITKSQGHFILQSEMTVINPQECQNTYPDILTASIFCAKFDVAFLLSDNGGAALHNGGVVGILSYGANIEDPPHIALLTNVTYFYKWIKLNTERLLTKHCSNELDSLLNNPHIDY